MGKIEESLESIRGIEDSTERAMALGGLVSTLFKLKAIVPVMIGRLAYDCYVGDVNTGQDLVLAIINGAATPRILQEVLGEQLLGEGMNRNWQIAGVNVEIQGDFISNHKELCRDFQTDFGIIKLMPLEEVIAERVLASFYPRDNQVLRDEAKRMISMGLANVYDIKWAVLQAVCDSNTYRSGEQLAALRTEAKLEVDAALGQTDSETGNKEESSASDTARLPEMRDLTVEQASSPDPATDH